MVVKLSAANLNETTLFTQLINQMPVLLKRRGRPRWRPGKVHADKGYDSKKNRLHLRSYGIIPRIARRGIESSQKLGRHRWVVERTFAWLHALRRLRIRYERKAEMHQAFLLLGCSLICFQQMQT